MVSHGESFLLVRVCIRGYGWYTNSKLLICLCGYAPRVATTVTHTHVGGCFDRRKNAPPKWGEKIPHRSGVSYVCSGCLFRPLHRDWHEVLKLRR